MKIAILGQGEFYDSGRAYLEEYGVKFHPQKGADLLICLGYPKILKKAEIDAYPKGVINFHPGLPDYRGRHPIQWMMIDGMTRIPVAVHYIDEGIDTGDVIRQDVVDVSVNDDYQRVLWAVARRVGPLLLEAIRAIENGTVVRIKQGPGRYLSRRTEVDGEIDWDWSPVKIHRFVNALAEPMPNAFSGRVRFTNSFMSERGSVTLTIAAR